MAAIVDISEKKKAQKDLEDILNLGNLLSDIALGFVGAPHDKIDSEISNAQSRICKYLDMDLSSMYAPISSENKSLQLSYLYSNVKTPEIAKKLKASKYFPWCEEQLLAGKTVTVSSMQELPPEAAIDRDSWKYYGIKSSLMFPLFVSKETIIGTISFDMIRKEKLWTESMVQRLRLAAQLFANVLERKYREDKLVSSEEKFRLSFMTGLDAYFWGILEDGQIIDINPVFEKLFGYTRDELIGRSSLQLGLFFDPNDRAKIIAEIKAKGYAKNIEIKGRKKDGKIVIVLYSASTVKLNNSNYVLGVVRDITEQKSLDEELGKYRLQLEDMVAQRTKEVELLSQLTFVSLEAASVGAWWIDFKEDDTYHALDTTAKMIGVPISQLPNKAYRISEWVNLLLKAKTIAPEYAGQVAIALEQFNGTISGKYEKYRVVYPLFMPDQTVKWIDARADVSSRDKYGKALSMTGTLIDVTQMVLVEKDLMASKTNLEQLVGQRTEELAHRNRDQQVLSERLKLATQAAKIGIWDWDVVKDDLLWDDAMYGLYGIQHEDFGGAYSAWTYTIHPDDKARAEKAINEALIGKREYELEFRVIWPDGSIHYIQAYSQTFRAPDGKPTRMIGVNWDITERKRAEEAVRDNEMRFRSFIEQSTVAIGVFSLEGIGLYSNQKFIEILGLTSLEEMVGRAAFEYFAPQYIEDSKERTRRRLQGLPVPNEYESVAIRSDGSQFPVHLAVASIHLPDGMASIAFLTDITERKKAESKLELNTHRIQALLQLNQMMDATLKEITDFTLEQAVQLSQSTIGYLAFLNADESVMTMHSWSRSAMAECAIENKPIVYPVVTTGLWGEAVRQRRPVITNDYSAANPLKKGFPQGHVDVKRHMNIPVLIGGQIVLVAGVGNKAEDYIQDDVNELTLLMEGMWRLLERSQSREMLQKSKNILDQTERIGKVGGWEFDIDTKEQTWTEEAYHIHEVDLSYKPTVENGINFYTPASRPIIERAVQCAMEQGESFDMDLEIITAKGNLRWIHVIGKADLEHRKVTGFFHDISDRKKTEEDLKTSYTKTEKILEETIKTLSAIVEIRDPYTSGHQQRVTQLAALIAKKMGLEQDRVSAIITAATVHDIGKINIPASILSKPGKINQLEYEMIKTHSETGYDMLRNIDFAWPVAKIVLQHHEKINGSGYPKGLRGDDIMLEAKIIAVADVVEAMSSNRPYRPSLGKDAALKELKDNKGILYDSVAVDACVKVIEEKQVKL